jgi:2'-5' RNA ligase
MAHHRLFVALRPPASARAALCAVMKGVPGARWQDDEQLHCTLRFLGELDRHAAEDVAAALGGLAGAPIEARLEAAGCFERNGRVDTLWIGVAPREPLRALHAKIDRLLARAGIAGDARAYLPHVTIARFARGVAPAPSVATTITAPDASPFLFEEVRLYESTLGSSGATYETVARYPLR